MEAISWQVIERRDWREDEEGGGTGCWGGGAFFLTIRVFLKSASLLCITGSYKLLQFWLCQRRRSTEVNLQTCVGVTALQQVTAGSKPKGLRVLPCARCGTTLGSTAPITTHIPPPQAVLTSGRDFSPHLLNCWKLVIVSGLLPASYQIRTVLARSPEPRVVGSGVGKHQLMNIWRRKVHLFGFLQRRHLGGSFISSSASFPLQFAITIRFLFLRIKNLFLYSKRFISGYNDLLMYVREKEMCASQELLGPLKWNSVLSGLCFLPNQCRAVVQISHLHHKGYGIITQFYACKTLCFLELSTLRVALLKISPHPSFRTNTAAYFMLRKTTNTCYVELVRKQGFHHAKNFQHCEICAYPRKNRKVDFLNALWNRSLQKVDPKPLK